MKVGRKIVSSMCGVVAGLCKGKMKTDFTEARKILTQYSPKPSGTCFAQISTDITYDLQVIIPAYNVERYIEKCLLSVVKLLDSEYKILIQIVDDGSTDRTGELIDQFAHAHEGQLSVIHQEKKGISGARNAALATIRGKYVMFLDSDDYLPENFNVDGVLSSLDGRDIVYGDYVTVGVDNNVIEHKKVDRFSGYAWGKLFHYTVFENFRFPEGFWFEDTPIKLILGESDYSIGKTNDELCCYRINPQGITSSSRKRKKAVDTYWITEMCLEEYPSFKIPYDQRTFDSFLRQSLINQKRVIKLPKDIRRAVFALTVELTDKYFSDVDSEKYKKLAKAIRERKFTKFELLVIAAG